MKKINFGPDKNIRNMDMSKIIGQTVTIRLEHFNKEKTDQYFSIVDQWNLQGLLDLHFYANGWGGKYLGKEKELKELKIVNAGLMEHSNGGRTDKNIYRTYKEFFNENRRKIIEKRLEKGFVGKLSYRGDPDSVDIFIEFDNGTKIESPFYPAKCPEEWYSDFFKSNEKFKFKNGFFKNSEDAIDYFKKSSIDDMFGTRYFPVLVYPKSLDFKKYENIPHQAKGHSDKIVTTKYVIYGTRCKPDEYQQIINETYRVGGKVAKKLQWDWE